MSLPSTINLTFSPSNTQTSPANNTAHTSQTLQLTSINQGKNETLVIVIDIAKIGMLTSLSYTGLNFLREYAMNLKPEHEADQGVKGFLAKHKSLLNLVTYPVTNPSMYSLAVASAYLYFKAKFLT